MSTDRSNRSNINSKTILFIGGGNMATAIIAGLINSEITPHNVTVLDHNQEKLNYLKSSYKINCVNNINKLSITPEIIILAVKPIAIKQACKDISQKVNENTIIISVAAGVTLENLSKCLPGTKNIIRSMPNTPATIQQGMTILYQNKNHNDLQHIKTNQSLANQLFQAVGQTLWVEKEEEINTTMALSGCGPAYIFLLCESLMAAGESLGINPDTCKQLITATIEGSCKLFEKSDKSASLLRKEVTSPNGTTEQAVNILDPKQSKLIYTKALEAAVKKAKLIEQELLN